MKSNKNFLYIVLCFIGFFSACSNTKKDDYIWKFVDLDFKRSNISTKALNHSNCFLNITGENEYVFFLNGYFSEGKVEKTGKEYKMLQAPGEKLIAIFKITEENRNSAKLNFMLFDTAALQKTRNNDEVSHSVELPVEALGEGFVIDAEKEKRSVKSDLYASKYNQWRIKPNRKESGEELKNRVRNHVEFMQAYFENALDLGLRSVSEPNLASPFEVYSNGISMRKFEEIKDWQDLFFDEEDARKGYDLLTNEMKKDFSLVKTKSAFELNADIFRKLLIMID